MDDVGQGTGEESFAVFYSRLKDLNEYHNKFPNVPIAHASKEDALSAPLPSITFRSTETYGRHLDLQEFYETFLNLSFTKEKRERDPSFQLTYRMYCSSFFEFQEHGGKDEHYVHYLLDLTAYLVDFLKRAQPLLDVADLLQKIDSEATSRFDSGAFVSWGDDASSRTEGEGVYCHSCQKMFAKKGPYDGHLGGKKHRQMASKRRQVVVAECRVNALGTGALADAIEATLVSIEKKQARTLRELLAENEEGADDDDDDDDGNDADSRRERREEEEEEQAVVRQIKNYPVGWDGEPIPYWLYRLHGLGVEYKCEICGNASYWGRRAFEKHFEDSRHIGGLKLLGINNSPHFFEIVRIQDALDLQKKLQFEQQRQWNPEEGVEMEDDQGRVYDYKTYELLRKQGVIREKRN